MKKLMLVLFSLAFLATSCVAQSFLKPLPKVSVTHSMKLNVNSVAVVTDSTMNAFRPIASVAAYTVPGNILLTGAGISYQHLKWDAVKQKWTSVWSIAGLGYVGAPLDPTQPASNFGYGLLVGFLNNLIMVGPTLNGNKVYGTIAIGVSLNN